jgi:glycosyltransferase involved in cell wall biosynthesis
MRILHLLSQRPGRSGSGVFLAALVREAARRGYEQHAIAAGPPGTSAAELPPLADGQLTPILFPSPEAPFPVPGNSDVMPYPSMVFSRMTEAQIELYLRACRRVMEEVRDRFQPDLVHAHHLWLMTALAREVFADRPVIATSHNAELRQLVKAPHLAPRVLPGVRGLDRIGVLTPQSVDDTIGAFGMPPERIELTGAGFRGDWFTAPERPRQEILRELRERFGIALPEGSDGSVGSVRSVGSAENAEPGIRFVTFVARLSTAKGVPFLLEAAARLAGQAPPFRLLLVGASGSGEDGLRMDAAVAAAGPGVFHLGAQPQEAVARLLQVSDAFVLPSLFEGLPLTMLEALGCGCPSVVSALPTIASWVSPAWREAGWVDLVPALATTRADEPVAADVPRFVADLAVALSRRLARRPTHEERWKIAAALRPHTWSAVFDRYERIYEEVCAEAPV